jgi:hypothetical protein
MITTLVLLLIRVGLAPGYAILILIGIIERRLSLDFDLPRTSGAANFLAMTLSAAFWILLATIASLQFA